MHLQTGHESEWLRHLRQTERWIRRETNADDYAATLTTEVTETQSTTAPYRAWALRISGWARRCAAVATAIVRRPAKATSRP